MLQRWLACYDQGWATCKANVAVTAVKPKTMAELWLLEQMMICLKARDASTGPGVAPGEDP
jgi:hypothetical protein